MATVSDQIIGEDIVLGFWSLKLDAGGFWVGDGAVAELELPQTAVCCAFEPAFLFRDRIGSSLIFFQVYRCYWQGTALGATGQSVKMALKGTSPLPSECSSQPAVGFVTGEKVV